MLNIKKDIWKSNKYDKLLGFVLSFVFLLILSMKDNVRGFIVDSVYYWDAGNRLWFDEFNELRGLNFLAFPETFRGYFWPFLLCTMKAFGKLCGIDVYLLYRVFSSISFAFFISFILPYLVGMHLSAVRYIIGVIAVTIFTGCFWKYFFEYPFSDAPAMILFMCGCAVAKSLLIQFERKEDKKIKLFLKGIILGILLYGAYNTRLIYLYADIVLVICLVVGLLKVIFEGREDNGSEKWKNSILLMGGIMVLMLLGMGIVAFPQMLINNQYIGKYTPRVLSEQLKGYTQSLSSAQVHGGLRLERLDGLYLGETDNGTLIVGALSYPDPSGMKLIEEASTLDRTNNGLGDMIATYFRYPFDVIGIYTKHFFSNITLLYDDWLVLDVGQVNKFDMLLNMLLWIMGGLALAASKWSIKGIWENRYLLCAAIPCILTTVGLPETRFYISLYYILYSFLSYKVNYIMVARYVREHLAKVVVSVIIFFAIWCMYIGNLLNIIGGGTYLIK